MRQSFANKKLPNHDFTGDPNLQHADFRSTQLMEANFRGCDLSFANFEGANCWGADFTDAKLYRTNFRDAVLANSVMAPKDCFGMTITMTCDTVETMKINEKFWYAWLIMCLLMTVPNEEAASRLIAVIGEERYTQYMRVFKERQV